MVDFSTPGWSLSGGRTPCLSARRVMQHELFLLLIFSLQN